jgi:hypothetical protein
MAITDTQTLSNPPDDWPPSTDQCPDTEARVFMPQYLRKLSRIIRFFSKVCYPGAENILLDAAIVFLPCSKKISRWKQNDKNINMY